MAQFYSAKRRVTTRQHSITQCPIMKPELNALIQPLYASLSDLQAFRRLGQVALVLADNGPLLVLRHFAVLRAADRQKLEQFSHKHQLSLLLAPGTDKLEQLKGRCRLSTLVSGICSVE